MIETLFTAIGEVLIEFIGLTVFLGLGFLVAGVIIYQYEKKLRSILFKK